MNAARRAALSAIAEKLESIKTDLEYLTEQEQEYYDNMPESFQSGEKGDKAQAAIDELESASSSLGEAIDYINASMEG